MYAVRLFIGLRVSVRCPIDSVLGRDMHGAPHVRNLIKLPVGAIPLPHHAFVYTRYCVLFAVVVVVRQHSKQRGCRYKQRLFSAARCASIDTTAAAVFRFSCTDLHKALRRQQHTTAAVVQSQHDLGTVQYVPRGIHRIQQHLLLFSLIQVLYERAGTSYSMVLYYTSRNTQRMHPLPDVLVPTAEKITTELSDVRRPYIASSTYGQAFNMTEHGSQARGAPRKNSP